MDIFSLNQNLLLHIVFDTIFMVICLSERISMNTNKKITHKQKHMTLSDRTYIEQELQQGSSFTSIAKVLSKDPSTISKEVKRNRDFVRQMDSMQNVVAVCIMAIVRSVIYVVTKNANIPVAIAIRKTLFTIVFIIFPGLLTSHQSLLMSAIPVINTVHVSWSDIIILPQKHRLNMKRS